MLAVIDHLIGAAESDALIESISAGRQILVSLGESVPAGKLRLMLKPGARSDAWIGTLVSVRNAESVTIENATLLRMGPGGSPIEESTAATLRWQDEGQGIRLTQVGGAIEFLTGRKAESIRREPELLFAGTDTPSVAKLRAAIERARVDLEPFKLRFPIRHAGDSELRWLTLSATANRNAQNLSVIDAVIVADSAPVVDEHLAEVAPQLISLLPELPGVLFQIQCDASGVVSSCSYVGGATMDVVGVDAAKLAHAARLFERIAIAEDLPGIEQAVREAARSGAVLDHEFRTAEPGDGVRWARAVARPKKIDADTFVINGVITDTTVSRLEREEAAGHAHAQRVQVSHVVKALDKSKRRLRELTRAAPGALFQCVADPHLTLTYISDASNALFGMESAALLGDFDNLFQCLMPPERAKLRADLAADAKQLKPWLREFEMRSADGTHRWLKITADPVVAADAQTCYYGLIEDVTELKLAQTRLDERDRLLQFVLANAGIGLLEWDIETGHIAGNAQLREIFGFSAEEPMTDVAQLGAREHTGDRARTKLELDALMRGAVDEFYCAYRIQAPKEKWRWVLAIGQIAERSPDGRALRYAGTVRAISTKNHTDALEHGPAGISNAEIAEFTKRFGIPGFVLQIQRAADGAITVPVFVGDTGGVDFGSRGDLPQAILDRIDPRDAASLESSLAAAARGLQTWECDFRIVDLKGRSRWLYLNARPKAHGDGSVLFTGFALDVTRRKSVEQALIASERRYRTLYDSAPIMMHSVDATGAIVSVNDQWLRALGYRREHVIGRRMDEYFARGSLGPIRADDVVGSGNERPEPIACELKKTDGTLRDVLLTANTERDSQGRFVGAQFSAIDVTERNSAVRALEESKARYRAVVHDQTEVICRFDPDRRLEFVNEACVRLTGRAIKDLVGADWLDLVDSAFHAVLLDALSTLSVAQPIIQQETRVVDPDSRWCQWTVRAFFAEDGELLGYQAVGRDIQQIKELEGEIRDISHREQKRIGHDLHDGLGQELTGVSLMLKTLERDTLRVAPELGPRIKSVQDMVAQCIGSSRALAQGLSPVHLSGDGFGGALGQLAANTESVYGIRVAYAGAPGVTVEDEETATNLYRIVQEALTNASKHACAQHIDLRMRVRGTALILEVEDDGIGFDPQVVDSSNMGLKIMRYRANIIGASIAFSPGSTGGTLMCCTLGNHTQAHETGTLA
jgi:PAS domain S-box-containing protein